MCTLTYFPKELGFTVTQNRDESPSRETAVYPHSRGGDWTYPLDPEGGGTWLTAKETRVLCVLNGGFVPHQRKLPYKHSRGLLPLLAQENPVGEALKASDAKGLEPFTLVEFAPGIVKRYTWDGRHLHRQSFDANQPQIFQSAPLYTEAAQAMRKMWFENFLLEHPSPNAEELLDFHLNGGDEAPELNICMYRPGVQTTSITQVDFSPKMTFRFMPIGE